MKQGQYPDAFYRVSVKGLISNEKGELLTVREGEDWTLPGGGIDHGETPLSALQRELYEEALVTADFEATFVGTESFYVDSKDAMAFWMIYEVKIVDASFAYQAGEEADEVAFRNPIDFQDSDSLFEQFIFKYGSMPIR